MPPFGRDSDADPPELDAGPDHDPERFSELMVADDSEFCDLLDCAFGVTEPVARLYRLLLDRPDSTVDELAEALDCDRSTVNRRLGTLREKGLVTRRRTLLSGGGVVYRYEPASLDRIEERMHRTLEEWTAAMHERIEQFREELEPGG